MSITPGIVAFNPAAFQADFPAFEAVSDSALTSNFNLATLQLNNSYCSVVQDEPTRAQLLNLLTAHITALLNGTTNAQGQLIPASGLVGRISSGTQGSVTVQTEFKTDSEAAAYYTQTQWGATYWQSTAIFRTFRYVSGSRCDEASWNAWPQ